MRRPAVDTVVALALTGAGLVEGWYGLTSGAESWVVLATVPAAAGSVALRRSRPLVAVGLFVATCLLQEALGSDLPGGLTEGIVAVLLAFTAGTRPVSRAWLPLTGLLLGMAMVIAVGDDPRPGNFVYLGVVLVASATAGYAVRVTRERGELLAEQKVLAERARIAGELHDVVTHGVSAMVIRAGAERRDQSPGGPAAATLAGIEQQGRETLTQLRALLGVLHADGEESPLAPQPGLTDLPELVAAAADRGLEVTVRAEGRPRAVGGAAGLTIFRVVQEALTNIGKHSGSTQATVQIQWLPDAVAVEVVDPGPRRSGPVFSRSGLGLRGMRTRVQSLGGWVETGDHATGFRVRALVPAESP